MSLEIVRVKEEVEWENEAEESDTAERAGMYAELETKLEIGPETIQQPNVKPANHDGTKSNIISALDVSDVKTEPIEFKVEPESVDELQLIERTDPLKIEAVDGCSKDAFAKCSVKLEGMLAEMFHKCKICGRAFYSISSFQTHMDSHEAIGVKTECYECDMCNKSFKKRSDLIEHIKCKQKSHSCATCRRHSSCASKFKAHEQYQNIKCMFSCKNCERIFRADRKLFLCERTCGRYIYRCKTCKQEFSKHHTVICDICKKVLTSKYTLKIHLRTHTGEKPYCCEICIKRFSRRTALISHRRVHTRDKPYLYSCGICNKSFSTKYILNDHNMRIHTGGELFTCNVCNRRFLRKSHLIKHWHTHKGQRAHQCDVCGRQFISKADMDIHQRVHTEERPFSCKICHMQFKKAGALRLHERLLKGQQPFACVICDKHFCNKKSLRAHQIIHMYNSESCVLSDSDMETPCAQIIPENIETEIKKEMAEDGESEPQKTVINTYKRSTAAAMFSCDICKKQFTKQSSLTQHVQILHAL